MVVAEIEAPRLHVQPDPVTRGQRAVIALERSLDRGEPDPFLLALEVAGRALGAMRITGALVGDVADDKLVDQPLGGPAPPVDDHVAEGRAGVLSLLDPDRKLLSLRFEVVAHLAQELGQVLAAQLAPFFEVEGLPQDVTAVPALVLAHDRLVEAELVAVLGRGRVAAHAQEDAVEGKPIGEGPDLLEHVAAHFGVGVLHHPPLVLALVRGEAPVADQVLRVFSREVRLPGKEGAVGIEDGGRRPFVEDGDPGLDAHPLLLDRRHGGRQQSALPRLLARRRPFLDVRVVGRDVELVAEDDPEVVDPEQDLPDPALFPGAGRCADLVGSVELGDSLTLVLPDDVPPAQDHHLLFRLRGRARNSRDQQGNSDQRAHSGPRSSDDTPSLCSEAGCFKMKNIVSRRRIGIPR